MCHQNIFYPDPKTKGFKLRYKLTLFIIVFIAIWWVIMMDSERIRQADKIASLEERLMWVEKKAVPKSIPEQPEHKKWGKHARRSFNRETNLCL